MRLAVVCVALAALAAVAVTAQTSGDFAFPCGTIYGWAESELGQGWQVQSLDFGTGEMSDPVQIDFDGGDDEAYVGAVAGHTTRTIYFFSDQNIYLYQIDEQEVFYTASYDNTDFAFVPWGYDDVTGHIWGTWTDQTDFVEYLARFDFSAGAVQAGEAEVIPGATLFLESSQRTIFQVIAQDADKGVQLLVRVNMFDVSPPANYTYPIYFPNAGEITIAQAGKTLSGGTTLVYDDEGNYISLNLASGVTQPSYSASIDDFDTFAEAYFNYAVGYYDGSEFSCDESSMTCFAFWDVLNEHFFPFNITVDNPSGSFLEPGQNQIYYATSC